MRVELTSHRYQYERGKLESALQDYDVALNIFDRYGIEAPKQKPEAISLANDSKQGSNVNDRHRMIGKLALARQHAASGDLKSAFEQSRQIFFAADNEERGYSKDQIATFYRKLRKLGLTHFTYVMIENHPLPITVHESVGTGTHATVDSIEIKGDLYARKSVALPRHSQRRLRDSIENEIAIIRTLEHPHIIEIFLTYEEKTRYCIIMQPLAEYDLEAFLMHQRCADIMESALVWKWLQCLANTLVFIHSQRIRHKDIKTRNILVKDLELIFADFGSSHAFLDEGASTTDGPSFGHTVMYCAPEVIAYQKRNRSADVFSLGCVFAEILTWYDGRSISDFSEHRTHMTNGFECHAYHSAGEKLDTWFADSRTSNTDTELIYEKIIKPMLRDDPRSRLAGEQMLETIQMCFVEIRGEDLEQCPKCSPFVRITELQRQQRDEPEIMDTSAG